MKLCRKPPRKVKKTLHFQNKRVHNPETLDRIHKKKCHTVRDFITEEF